MKKTLILLAITISLLTSGFTLYSLNQKTATVDQTQGVYCYIGSQPTDSYDVVFTVKIGVVWANGQINSISEIRDHLIKKANKKGISYEALIFDGNQTATAINFQ